MNDLPNFLLLAGALVLLEYLIFALACTLQRPLVASGAILSLLVVEATFITLPAIPAGVTLYAADLVFVPIALAGVARILFTQGTMAKRILAGSLFALFVYSFSRGAAAFGLISAGVEARGEFYFLAGVLYFSTFAFDEVQVRRVIDQWLVACVALTGLAVFRWSASIAGLPYLNLTESGTWWQGMLVYILGPIVLVLQHRTVWIACLMSMLCLVIVMRSHRHRLIVWLGTFATVAAVLFLITGSQGTGSLVSALQASSTDTGTFEWRLEGWKQLLSSDQEFTIVERMLGRAFGSGYEREVYGFVVEHSPHSFYVQTLLRIGGIGLGILLGAYAVGLRYSPTVPDGGDLSARRIGKLWVGILIMQLIYFVSYSPPHAFGIILGIAIGSRLTISASQPYSVIPSSRQTWQTVR